MAHKPWTAARSTVRRKIFDCNLWSIVSRMLTGHAHMWLVHTHMLNILPIIFLRYEFRLEQTEKQEDHISQLYILCVNMINNVSSENDEANWELNTGGRPRSGVLLFVAARVCNEVQWNFAILDTNGNCENVLTSGMSLYFRGLPVYINIWLQTTFYYVHCQCVCKYNYDTVSNSETDLCMHKQYIISATYTSLETTMGWNWFPTSL